MSIIFLVATEYEINNQKTLFGHPVLITGIGKINATYAACKAINSGYTHIINIGSSGSLSLNQGEVIKIGEVYQDIDLTPLCEYGETLFEKNSSKIKIDESIFSCLTTDYFIDFNQKQKYSSFLLEKIKFCSVFDMECFAIAKVCMNRNIKFESFKWISDSGDSSEWLESCKIGFSRFKKIFKNERKKERI